MQSNLIENPGIISMVKKVQELQTDERLKDKIEKKMNEFRIIHNEDSQKWYEELVYCLLTAYSSAYMGQRCVDSLCNNELLLNGSLNNIQNCLINEGHRFAKRRAEYIYYSRELSGNLKSIIKSFKNSQEAREWLVKNIKGLGWKESSHFLRNVGYFDLAIIDRHILANLNEHGLLEEDTKKGLTKKRYLKYEKILEQISKRLNILPGELDLYLWYRKTGKVLK